MKMKTKIIYSLSTVVLAGMVFNAQATDFNYNFIEGSYESYDLNGTDADAGKLSGSYELTPNLNIIGDYAAGNIDSSNNSADDSELDFQNSAIGFEYHAPIAPKTDVTTNIKYINQDIDTLDDDDGYGVGVGVRHKVTDKVELDANLDYYDIDNSDDTRLKVGARYYFNKSISAGIGYSASQEDTDTISGNIRWGF